MISNIKEKLADMQAKYLDKEDLNHLEGKMESRKTAKIKKKLANLEVERCHKLLDNQDCTAIDKKINKQKKLYSSCRSQKG